MRVITDLGVLEPDEGTCELVLTAVHQGVTVEQALRATGLGPAHHTRRGEVTEPPTHHELAVLRELTRRADDRLR